MGFTLTEDSFTTEAEAHAEIARIGWHALAMDVVSSEEESHWDDFDTVVFVVEGTARAECEYGSILAAGPGVRVDLPARVVHSDVIGCTYRGIFGFSVDPAEMTRPVNKPAA